MKIEKVHLDVNGNEIRIETAKGPFIFQLSEIVPADEKVKNVIIDPELGNEAITIYYESGGEDSLHVDAFLARAGDPDFMRDLALYKVCVLVDELVKNSGVTQREIAKGLNTSIPQVSRVLNTTNYKKTIDQLVRVAAVVGFEIEFSSNPIRRVKTAGNIAKFKYRSRSTEDVAEPFNGLRLVKA